MATKKKPKKKRKIKVSRVLFFLAFLAVIINCVYYFINIKITNIYIFDNYYLKDQEIIEMAGLENYPSTFQNLSYTIENKLENNTFIKVAKVSKSWFTSVNIEIIENRPLFYYEYIDKTILLDGTSVNEQFAVPTVLNYIVDSIYSDFIKQLGEINSDIINRISEIEYKPNSVDDNRFLLTMIDGNYVYVNIGTFYKLNKYLEIVKNFPNKNGILYLDYGNNFEIIN